MKPDKPDSISGKKSLPKDKFGRPVILCPKKHKTVRHRRRNGKQQFYCKICNEYYTDNTALDRIERQADYYDQFIQDYINISVKNKRPNVAQLCLKYRVSRATVYRHLFTADRKPILLTFIELYKWAGTHLDGLYQRNIVNGELVLKHKNSYKGFILTLKTAQPDSLGHLNRITGQFNQDVSKWYSHSAYIKFDSNGRQFFLSNGNVDTPLPIQLSVLTTLLKNI